MVQSEREIRHYVRVNRSLIVWALSSWVLTLSQKRNYWRFLSREVHDLTYILTGFYVDNRPKWHKHSLEAIIQVKMRVS